MSSCSEVAPNSKKYRGHNSQRGMQARIMESVVTGWRRQQQQQPLQEEDDSPQADVLRRKPSSGSLNALRMSLRKRLPLKQVDFNVEQTPTWESLELAKKPTAIQALGRTARSTWGNVSQKLQKRRQSRSEFLVVTPSKAETPQTPGSGSRKRTPRRTPRSRDGRLRGTPPRGKRTPGSSKASWREAGPPGQLGQDGLPLRRSIRSAALKSPYGTPRAISRQRQFDRDLESVSFGIGQLKRLSQVFDEAITKEERAQAIENYYQVMSKNLQLSKVQAKKLLSSSVRRRTVRLCSALTNWADGALASITERRRKLN